MRAFRREALTVLLALIFVMLCSAPASGAVELSHDKGKPSYYRTLTRSFGFAVSFSPPSSDWPIQSVRVYGFRFGNQTEKMEVIVEIWGANRSVLYSQPYSYTKFSTVATWVDLEVTNVVVSGSFVVVIYTNSVFPTSPGPPDRGVRIYNDNSVAGQYSDIAVRARGILMNWAEVGFGPPSQKREDTNWMIRVVGGGGALDTATSQPFLGFLNMSTLQQIGGIAATGAAGVVGWFS